MQQVSAHQYFSTEERKALMEKNDFKAIFEVLVLWIWIIGVFAVVYTWTNLLTIIVGMLILGGRQLACSVLMHDSGHRSLLKNSKQNDFIGQWLGAYPIFHNMLKYRPYHNIHHLHTGLEEDPDLLLIRGYPTSRKSMIRKLIRDFTGQTGIKAFAGLVMMNLGYLEYNLGGKIVKISQKDRTWGEFWQVFLKTMGGIIIFQVLFFTVLTLVASPWLYLLWIGSYLTTLQFVIRIRSIAEHSVLKDSTNPLLNTRTTYANPLERLLFAPFHVNYHAEHHMLMSVPSYNLPKMHRMLKERGFYEHAILETGYWNVIKLATRKREVN